MSPPRSRWDWPGRIALIAASVLFSLATLEVASRLLRSGPQALLHWPNLARRLLTDAGPGATSCSYIHDDLLGWALPSNCVSPGYNLDSNGFRRQSALAVSPAGPPVLAMGSSFALGSEVTDEETWPAYLQGDLGRAVVNAGVSGYSLDQTVLNTERLAARLRPSVIVVSFTPGDVWRNELAVAYSHQKPFFAPSGGQLELRNVPIARLLSAPPLPVAARLLGWSAVADEVVERLGVRDGWYYSEARAPPAGMGDTVSCLLMARLAQLGNELGIPVVVMAQYGLGHWRGDADYQGQGYRSAATVLRCATEAGLVALDLAPPLKAAIDARGFDALYRSEHHSSEGNRLVAELLAGELVRHRLLPPGEP